MKAKMTKKLNWKLKGTLIGLFVTILVFGEIGLHWVLPIPILQGFVLGFSLDKK